MSNAVKSGGPGPRGKGGPGFENLGVLFGVLSPLTKVRVLLGFFLLPLKNSSIFLLLV